MTRFLPVTLPVLIRWVVCYLGIWLAVPCGSAELQPSSPFHMARPAIAFQAPDSPLTGATIYDLVLDDKGCLWTATREGVFRVEGNTAVPFPLPFNAPAANIRSMVATRDGSLWFGTESGGLWHTKDGFWTSWNKQNGLPGDCVNALMEAPDGSVWAACGEGLARFQEGAIHVYGEKEGLFGKQVWKVRTLHDRYGGPEMWAVTEEGMFIFNGSRFTLPKLGANLPDGNFCDVVDTIDRKGHRNYWVNSWQEGIYQWDGNRWILHNQSNGLASLTISSLAVSHLPGQVPTLWAGSYDQGLFCYEEGRWHHFPPSVIEASGIYALKANPTGEPTLWLGCRGAGLLSLHAGSWHLLDAKNGLPSQDVTCIASAEEAQGATSFWVGTGNGLFKWHDSKWTADPQQGGLPNRTIYDLLVTKQPEGYSLWACTNDGIACWRNRTWKYFKSKEGITPHTPFWIRQVVDDDGKATVMAFSDEMGLMLLDNATWRCVEKPSQLPFTNIVDLCQVPRSDGTQYPWVASKENGVAFKDYTKWISCNKGLKNHAINNFILTMTSQGVPYLWASTSDFGIARLNTQRPYEGWYMFDTSRFPMMLSNQVHCLAKDNHGYLYGTTNRGIFKLRIEEINGIPIPMPVHNYTRADGLPAITQINAFHLDIQDRLWFGTLKGAVILDTNSVSPEFIAPTPLLKRVLTDGSPLDPTKRLVLASEKRHLTFEFWVPFHHRPEDIRFRTQILGLESEPSQWVPENRYEIANIAPGQYTLRVWALDYLGRMSKPLDIPFAIEVSPWRRSWALLLYVAAIVAGVGAFFHFRELLLKRRNTELESLVAQRTQELESSNEGLIALNHQHMHAIAELHNALAEVKTLQGIIPICMQCKKIRDDAGYWNQLEAYMSKHSSVKFSHGYCPECAEAAHHALEEYKQQHPMKKEESADA